MYLSTVNILTYCVIPSEAGFARGDVCKKNGKLLYENENKGTVLDSAAMHLCNQDEHAEFSDFYIARDCATEGLTKKIMH